MTRDQVRTAVGFVVVILQLLSLASVVIGFFLGGFRFDEMTTTVAIITPLSAAYVALVVRFAVEARGRVPSDRRKASALLILTAMTFPLCFGMLVWVAIVAWAGDRGFENFEQFKVFLGLSEVAFGVYLSRVVKGLFNGGD